MTTEGDEPAVAPDAAASGEKSEKLLKREAEKAAKKAAKEAAKASKAAAAEQRSRGQNAVVSVQCSTTPPVELEACSGTRDWYPGEFRLQRWLYEKFRATARASGFAEYDATVLERQEL